MMQAYPRSLHALSPPLSHPLPIMSHSRTPSDTEEKHFSQTPLSRESAGDTPAADNLCPNLDDEVSAARGAGVFASLLPHTRSCCVYPMSYADLAIPQKREREVSLEAATPHPDDIVRKPDHLAPPLSQPSDLKDRNLRLLSMTIARSPL